MINLIFILLAFLILIYKKVILLNEETLILLCFITFIFLSMNSFGSLFKKSLDEDSNKIKIILENSLKQVCTLLARFSNLNANLKNVLNKFQVLGNYYYELIPLIIHSLPKYNNCKLVTVYSKRLTFLSSVEKKTVKLLSFVIINKLHKIVKLKLFYNKPIQNNYFVCLKAVSLRESIQLISLKK